MARNKKDTENTENTGNTETENTEKKARKDYAPRHDCALDGMRPGTLALLARLYRDFGQMGTTNPEAQAIAGELIGIAKRVKAMDGAK